MVEPTVMICKIVAPPSSGEHAACPAGWQQYKNYRATEGCASILDNDRGNPPSVALPTYKTYAEFDAAPSVYCGVADDGPLGTMWGYSTAAALAVESSPFADGAVQATAEVKPATFSVSRGSPMSRCNINDDCHDWTKNGHDVTLQKWKWDGHRTTTQENRAFTWGARGSYSGNGALRLTARISEMGCY